MKTGTMSAVANSDILLGITWGNSLLVSFNPHIGNITEYHTQLNPNESFRGLTYDSNNNKLYALSQVDWNLYSIDPDNLDVTLIGKLNIDKEASWGEDIGGLTYNPATDKLYTPISHWDSGRTNLWSELAEVNPDSAEVSIVGTITNGYCNSLSFSETDDQLYGFACYGSGTWDSPHKSSVVRINPNDAAMTALFQTSYHTILGLAKKPGEDTFYSWVNWTSHFYGAVDLINQTITPLGISDPVGVSSDAMIYRDFYVAPEPTEADVSGCIKLKGVPVVDRKVILKQEGESRQTTRTDTTGCFEFEAVVSGKEFTVKIKGPVVPE